jgi:YfiH family protein
VNNYITFECLDKLNIKNAFIGKPYDFSNLNHNRVSDISKVLNIDINKVYQANQTHSSNIEVVLENDDINSNKFNNVDGLLTNVKGVTLLIKVADCQGIFLYDPVKEVIGNIHSGWKGTADKIIIKAIDKMALEYGSNLNDIIVCVNPCIQSCHFEIEEDVLNIFKEKIGLLINEFLLEGEVKDGKQKYYLDLVNLNKRLLITHGLIEENIYLSRQCTVCESDKYYSYRADKTPKRNGCVISLSK